MNLFVFGFRYSMNIIFNNSLSKIIYQINCKIILLKIAAIIQILIILTVSQLDN